MSDEIEVSLPNATALEQALEVAGTNLEVLQDLDESLKARVKKAGKTGEYTEIFSGLSGCIDKARYIQALISRTKYWDGDADMVTEIEKSRADHQTYRALKDFKAIEAQLEDGKVLHITMLYDINKNGQFVRGYMDNQRVLDPEIDTDKIVIDTMDEAFHAWMVSQEMVSKKGVIYKANDLDANDEPKTKVDPKTFETRLSAEEGGYVAVAKDMSSSVQLTLQRQGASPAKDAAPQ